LVVKKPYNSCCVWTMEVIQAVEESLSTLQNPNLRLEWLEAWQEIIIPETAPVGEGSLLLQGCQQAVRYADEPILRAWYNTLKAWMSDLNEDNHKTAIIGQDCKDAANDVAKRVLVALHCALVACKAERCARASTEKTAKELLQAVWQTLHFSAATGGMVSTEPPPKRPDLAKALLTWTTSGDTALTLAAQAFDLLCKQIPALNAPPVAFLHHLTAYIIDPTSQREASTRITAPFALVTQTPQGEPAVLAQFIFERLPDGHSELFLTPTQAFLPMDHEFCRLFTEVPYAVRSWLEQENAAFHRSDLRVRIERLDTEGQFILQPLTGNSASGAAAWGLYFAWTGKIPDDGIIVLAQIDANGTAQGVQHVREKVEAIAANGHFDTVIVASNDNQRSAEATLRALGHLGPIRVVNLNASET
jgi:hypothetical protein